MLRRFQFITRTWFWLLVAGVVLFIVLERIIVATGNHRLLPAVLVVGAFVVPVAFVAWIYQRVPDQEIPLITVASAFLLSGLLGVLVAAVLEYETLRHLGVIQLLGVGVIEESAKLLVPIVIYRRGRYRSEADGLLFGVASGMGFASLETMGYGLVALIQSQGSLGAVEETLLVRGLLSPAGHAAWTGLVCAVLWRERERAGHAVVNPSVVIAFLIAVLLHTIWDTLGAISTRTAVSAWLDIIGMGVVALVSLGLLLRRVHEASRKQT